MSASESSSKPQKDYKLLIIGPVGAGKTTIIHLLSDIIEDIKFVPEFADSPIGLTILQEYLAGRASAITLQNYVLDVWKNFHKSRALITFESNETEDSQKEPRKKYEGVNISCFDRCPDDALYCFCNIRNNAGEIDDFAFMSLMNRTKELNDYYPSYFNPKNRYTFVKNDQLMECIDFITSLVESDIQEIQNSEECDCGFSRIICLEVTDEQCITRVKRRARGGESGYTDEMLKTFNKHYHKLYKYINTHQQIRMLDIGKLL
jgi:deoxyadenosine/deoxycytidine kinase